jgi:FKBP-type peptidyl-prolyl cis-trans isomerase SlyD
MVSSNGSDEESKDVGRSDEIQVPLPAGTETATTGKLIQVDFILRDAEGQSVQADQSSFSVIIGSGQLLPRIEGALIGLSVGDRATLKLQPKEAFGERDAAKVIEFDRDEFPSDVVAGDHFEAEQDGGAVVVLRIVEVEPDFVKVDLNHPLAGQRVELEFVVKGIRQADEQELADAQVRAKTPSEHTSNGLMPVGRLLRGRAGR